MGTLPPMRPWQDCVQRQWARGIVAPMADSTMRVLSGIQPSGALHLGNYFGAIQQHIELQTRYPGECLFFIADYHALTTLRDPAALRQNVLEVAIAYLSVGLDPDKALLFRQSDVPEVLELSWLLATVTGMGLLERAHSYKDKLAHGIKPNVGLFTYPILMASDILVYRANVVPVGKDQVQHVEMAQDMATYFNQTFPADPHVLRRPEALLSATPYVPGLDGRKMSKSYGNTIPMFAHGKTLRKLVAQIVTDSTPLGQALAMERCNVFGLLRLLLPVEQLAQVETWYRTGQREGAAFGYGHAKQLLVEQLEQRFSHARAKREALLVAREEVEHVLVRSAQRARSIARETMAAARSACGLC